MQEERDSGHKAGRAAAGEGDNRPRGGNMAEVEGQVEAGVEEVGA